MENNIAENIQSIESQLVASKAILIAVTKTKSIQLLGQAYEAGFKRFGENYVQELVDKYQGMPKDIEWHFIGHLQSNKVKHIAPFVSIIHSVDSLKLLIEINKQAQKNHRIIDCLLQIYIAEEKTKTGLDANELRSILVSKEIEELKNIRIIGLMGMATFTDDKVQIREEFRNLKKIFDETSLIFHPYYFKEISMGMSSDYLLAVEEGSTMVRVGSAIFGARIYTA